MGLSAGVVEGGKPEIPLQAGTAEKREDKTNRKHQGQMRMGLSAGD